MGLAILATFVYLLAVVGVVIVLLALLILLRAWFGYGFKMEVGNLKDKGKNGKAS